MKVVERLNISKITPTISEWICKVLVIECPRESRNRNKKYQLFLFQEEEVQLLLVLICILGAPLKTCNLIFYIIFLQDIMILENLISLYFS